MWYIYKHTNKINNKTYIGQTKQNVHERWRNNGIGYATSAPLLWKAIQKYGWDNFTHEIIESNIKTQELANEREQYWIQYYDCCVLDGKDKGYNIDRGGKGFTSERASIESKKNWAKPEYRELFTKKVICTNTQMIYPSIVDAAAATGINKTGIAKCCNHVHNSAGKDEQGTPLVWEFYIENKIYPYIPASTKNKRLQPVICINTQEIFNSITQAAEYYNISYSTISACCNNKGKFAGKDKDGNLLIWAYYEPNKTYKMPTIPVAKTSGKAVIRLEDKQVFNTIKAAADAIGGHAPNITRACNTGGKCKGYHWMLYSEYLEKYGEAVDD